MRMIGASLFGLFAVLVLGPAALVTATAAHPAAASAAARAPASSAAGPAGLDSPALTLSSSAAGDIRAGIVDTRVVALLGWMAARHRIVVSVIRTGHSEYVAGTTRLSNHWWGRAVDVAAVDGQTVSAASPASRALVVELEGLTGGLAPSEIGEPFPDLAGGIVFSDAAHRNHIHVGYGPAP